MFFKKIEKKEGKPTHLAHFVKAHAWPTLESPRDWVLNFFCLQLGPPWIFFKKIDSASSDLPKF